MSAEGPVYQVLPRSYKNITFTKDPYSQKRTTFQNCSPSAERGMKLLERWGIVHCLNSENVFAGSATCDSVRTVPTHFLLESLLDVFDFIKKGMKSVPKGKQEWVNLSHVTHNIRLWVTHYYKKYEMPAR